MDSVLKSLEDLALNEDQQEEMKNLLENVGGDTL